MFEAMLIQMKAVVTHMAPASVPIHYPKHHVWTHLAPMYATWVSHGERERTQNNSLRYIYEEELTPTLTLTEEVS